MNAKNHFSVDDVANDWKIFTGLGVVHTRLRELPPPPPWRLGASAPLTEPEPRFNESRLVAEGRRAGPFIVSESMRRAVNAALYLRRPLLLTGNPGTGKSTLIAKVAHELQLGPVLRWPINSRSTVRSGVYEYDAIGRLQAGSSETPRVQDYLTLGPLGTALTAVHWPRALLIDEIDKSDLDFANDLLNVIEEGSYEIPELRRLKEQSVTVRDADGREAVINGGLLDSNQFPFVVMTSNAEREFPAPFLRRCVRLKVQVPTASELHNIIRSQLVEYHDRMDIRAIDDLVASFVDAQSENQEVATDQLLNAVFLTIAMKDTQERCFGDEELAQLRADLLRPLSGSDA